MPSKGKLAKPLGDRSAGAEFTILKRVPYPTRWGSELLFIEFEDALQPKQRWVFPDEVSLG